jgi:hypothetical protein
MVRKESREPPWKNIEIPIDFRALRFSRHGRASCFPQDDRYSLARLTKSPTAAKSSPSVDDGSDRLAVAVD